VSFEQFSFDRRIAAAIKTVGYTTPTPIQQQAIPPVLAGRDVLGLAQVGVAYTFASEENGAMVHEIEKVLGAQIERRRPPGFNYGDFARKAIPAEPSKSAVRPPTGTTAPQQTERRDRWATPSSHTTVQVIRHTRYTHLDLGRTMCFWRVLC
jgi:superfamily II DNA/RNA helicase